MFFLKKRYWFRVGDKKYAFTVYKEKHITLLNILAKFDLLNYYINMIICKNFEEGVKIANDYIIKEKKNFSVLENKVKELDVHPKQELFESFYQNRRNYNNNENIEWLKARGKKLVESPKELLNEFNQKINDMEESI